MPELTLPHVAITREVLCCASGKTPDDLYKIRRTGEFPPHDLTVKTPGRPSPRWTLATIFQYDPDLARRCVSVLFAELSAQHLSKAE